MKAAEVKAELGDAADAPAPEEAAPAEGAAHDATPMDADGGEGVALDPPAVALGAGHHGERPRRRTVTKSGETSATIGIGGNGDERRVPSQVRQRGCN